MKTPKKATGKKQTPNKAARALAKAIDSCDAEGIRQAIAQGASLTALPDTSWSPLVAALYKFEEAEWKECAELLIELGCPVNGANDDPPIIYCVDEDFSEPDALEVLEVLVAHGADVNATDLDGQTALFRCVVDNRLALARFLLQHGADPNLKDRNGVSPVKWLRGALQRELQFDFDERTQYAELLSLLTGKPAARPQPQRTTSALAAESARFRACVAARRLVPMVNANITLRRKDDSPYAKRRWYRDWHKELLDAGFEFAQHFALGLADYSAFTNTELGFDALLCEGDRPRCQIIAYHSDPATTTVASFAETIGPEFEPQSRVFETLQGASPVQLTERLKELVRGKAMMRVDASSFASRYTEALNRLAHEVGERALHLLKTPTIFIDGAPPRWERVGCYFDFVGAGWKDPNFSTANWVRDWQEELAKADTNPPDSTNNALRTAVNLVAASHLQFASAPNANELLASASEVALAHFQSLTGAGKKATIAHPTFQFQALLRGLFLCALAGRWDTFKKICDLVQPNLASANTADEEDLDFAQVLLLLVSSHRQRPLPKAAALEQGVAKRLAKHPRLLLEIWRAIRGGRATDFEETLLSSLSYFMEELRGDRLVPAQRLPPKMWNHPFSYVALPESLFYLAARERGLRLLPLEPRFADVLITPETIGMARGADK